ncbi:MAG: transposase [Candidatus Omnitrophota bacterium]|nr:transposase [Candidatus Omnitrophota bacterium]
MPRIRRLIPSDAALHVVCRGNNKQRVFNSDSDKLKYYALLRDLKAENRIDIYHYSLMDNHVHAVVFPNQGNTLSRFMKQLNLSYALYYKKQYSYCGHLWQDRFKSCIVENDSYLLQCGKYIELNPVRAHMVKNPGDYRFSSYAYYAYGKADSLVTPSPAYIDLSDDPVKRQEKYVNFVIESNQINARILEKQAYAGSQAFIERLEQYYSIKNIELHRGDLAEAE